MTDDFVADTLGRLQPVEPRRAFADRLFEQFSAAFADEAPPRESDAGDVVVMGDLELWTDDGDDHDRRHPRRLLVAVAAAVLMAVVAVGVLRGRDSRVVATRPAKQQFIVGAGAICRDDDVALTRLYAGSPQSPAVLQPGIVALLGDVVARFGQLGLPPADTARLQPALDDLRTAQQLARAGLASYAAVRRATQVLFDYGAIACNPDLVPLYPTTTVP